MKNTKHDPDIIGLSGMAVGIPGTLIVGALLTLMLPTSWAATFLGSCAIVAAIIVLALVVVLHFLKASLQVPIEFLPLFLMLLLNIGVPLIVPFNAELVPAVFCGLLAGTLAFGICFFAGQLLGRHIVQRMDKP